MKAHGKVTAPDRLLAKQPNARFGELSLERHLSETEQAARAIFDPSTRAGKNFLRFFRLPSEEHGRFFDSLRVAALLHDVGKANEAFDAVVRGQTKEAQPVRHEHFSALILCVPAVKDWLSTAAERVDYGAVCGAVLSHHLKAAPLGSPDHAWCQPSRDVPVRLYLGHEEIKRTLLRIADLAGLGTPPALPSEVWSTEADGWAQALRAGRDAAEAFRRSLRRAEQAGIPPHQRQVALAVKSALIAADGVASAMFREGLSIDAWVAGTLHSETLTRATVWNAVIEKRVDAVDGQRRARGLDPFHWHQFQTGAEQCAARTLMMAGCGAGKTLAAWRWIAQQCEARPVGRVVFLYPTRGTATEGFRDYVGWAPEAEAALVHGTAGYELEAIRENPSEATRGKSFDEGAARLFALGLWSKRYFSATVDQFVGFMEHGYASMCLLPVLADAVVVLDEVHSYDKRLFENVVSFLRAFDVPVLAMTATLPPARQQVLRECELEVFPSETARAAMEDLQRLEGHPRYRLVVQPTADGAVPAALARCEHAMARGERVLWVVNTVARAQALARELCKKLGAAVLCYHSRFKLADRQRAHTEAVKQFQSSSGACLAVATQVCEMSLDLDADVLLTELAPLSSIVQRMGRANRHLRRGLEFRGEVFVYEPERSLPYTRDELVATRGALAALSEEERGGISQARLAALLEEHSPAESNRTDAGAFLKSGWYAVSGSLREEDDFTRPCVLDSEIAEVAERRKRREPIDGYLVPVPKKCVIEVDPKTRAGIPQWLGVAPSKQYSAALGFEAEPESA